MSPLCEECKVNNFEILCRGCKKIISCDDCFNKKKNKACKNCGVDLSKEDIVKVFMNWRVIMGNCDIYLDNYSTF